MPKAARRRSQSEQPQQQQLAVRCRHFTGLLNRRCAAGVVYSRVRDPNKFAYPCFSDSGCSVVCDKASFPTAEEAKLEAKRREKRLGGFLTALNAAHADAEENGFGIDAAGSGSLPCPVCNKGTLRYVVAALNGHMHAACSTPGCVRWME